MAVWHIECLNPKFKFFVKMAPNTKILLQTVNVDLSNKNNEENNIYALH